jgi:hypothetical protein
MGGMGTRGGSGKAKSGLRHRGRRPGAGSPCPFGCFGQVAPSADPNTAPDACRALRNGRPAPSVETAWAPMDQARAIRNFLGHLNWMHTNTLDWFASTGAHPWTKG